MLVKFKIPQIDRSISWLLDWKMPYFPQSGQLIRIDYFLSDDIEKTYKCLNISQFLELCNENKNENVPQKVIEKLRTQEIEALSKLSILDNFLNVPCEIGLITWLRNNKGEGAAYIEILLDFDSILNIHF